MANNSLLNTPTLWVNKYIQQKIALSDGGIGVPFFPTTPSTIDDLTEQWIKIEDQRYSYAGVMATWDRLFRMNKKGFPHIKCEQIMYYFYATRDDVTENMVKVQENILRHLDRMDESAQEINDWCSNRQIDLGVEGIVDCQFYFHNFKVYQLEEVRDIIDFGTARTYGGNKVIIEFDYHQIGDISNPSWQPEAKPATKYII